MAAAVVVAANDQPPDLGLCIHAPLPLRLVHNMFRDTFRRIYSLGSCKQWWFDESPSQSTFFANIRIRSGARSKLSLRIGFNSSASSTTELLLLQHAHCEPALEAGFEGDKLGLQQHQVFKWITAAAVR